MADRETPEGGLEPVFLGRRTAAARHQIGDPPGLHREVQRQRGRGDEPHDRGDARLHANLDLAAAAERSAQIRDRKTRRRSGVKTHSVE